MINALLARSLLAINREFERDAPASLAVYADLLRAVPEPGISVRDLPSAARVSRRVVRAMLGLEKRGWLTVDNKVVRLTARGHEVRDSCAECLTAARWPALGEALAALVRQFALELPHYPMTYGPVDVSALGGRAVAARPPVPAHGSDWAPVLREHGDEVRDLPLHALLSQALMAFTIDHEARVGGFPMAVAAVLGRAMPSGAAPLGDLPAVLGVRGNGKTTLERHGIVEVTGSGTELVATLTARGVFVRDAYEPVAGAVTTEWRTSYGNGVVDELVAALEAVDANLPADLPDLVLVRFSGSMPVTVTQL